MVYILYLWRSFSFEMLSFESGKVMPVLSFYQFIRQIIRLESQLSRFKTSSENAEKIEDELKAEKRRLQREVNIDLLKYLYFFLFNTLNLVESHTLEFRVLK